MTDVGETQTQTDAAAQPKPSVAQTVLERQIEAILMTVERPIPAGRIAEALDLEGTRPVTAAIEALNRFYQQHDLSFRIEQVAGGYQVFTLPKYHDVLTALHRGRTETRLSPAALETLAIIAYRQPALRAEIEAIRGVACGEVIRTLMDRHLVKIVGRAEEIGRPMLYGTTRTFLEMFGLASLKDLPKAEELNKP